MVIKKGTKIKVLDQLFILEYDKKPYNVYLSESPMRKISCINIEGEDIPLEIIEIIDENKN